MPMLVFGLNEENSIVNAANGKINGNKSDGIINKIQAVKHLLFYCVRK